METLKEMHEVVARKEHRCSRCGKRIFKGEAHRAGTFKTDSVYTWRECGRCAEMVGEFFASNGYLDDWITGEDFLDWLKETYPVTRWEWALEDARVRRSELKSREGEMDKTKFKYLMAAASCTVAGCMNELDMAERAGRIEKLEALVLDMEPFLCQMPFEGADAKAGGIRARMAELGLLEGGGRWGL